jgi:hypothetical protein
MNGFAPKNENVWRSLECGGWRRPCHDDEENGGLAVTMKRKAAMQCDEGKGDAAIRRR